MLVTGASGFVGSAVVRHLIRSGRTVRVMVRRDSDRRNLAGLPVETVVGDLTKPETLPGAVRGCAGLFHVAADYRMWVPDRDRMFAANVEGTRHLMLAAAEAGVERIVHTSSVATLGIVPGGVADEETPVSFSDMIGPYKQSKFLGEAAVRELQAAHGLPVVIVNPSTPIGPHDIRPTPTGKMVLDAASGRMPAYVDTGLNIVHVDDVAAGHLLAFEKGVPGERYILGGENMTLREILTVIADLSGRTAPWVHLPHSSVLPIAQVAELFGRLTGIEPFVTVDAVRLARKRMFFSPAKAERLLGYCARPAVEALRAAIDGFREQGRLAHMPRRAAE
ncbi:NAD-dependent epimerase/dehydratase family protein [Limibaculum sp. FT325]|uniref:hopanoid-associated sugar epimerase n=1 Tax=Thermohalobaculum sediminis TaxID=2939436 RepID=UPI0020BEFFE1|nr:hopanoid-associated sugar epimerase [Limibaculum sediminis]MCL5778336.1 NAD-dependent epimerase/dehydratase family protein [Limibaculum sediminis]